MFFGCIAAWSGTDVTSLWELKQSAKIKAVNDSLNGVLGVATIDLTSGRVFVYNGDAVFPPPVPSRSRS